MVAQENIHLPQLHQGHRQELLAYLLIGMLLLLMALSAKVAYQYALPPAQWINLGSATQYPINQPRAVAVQGTTVWVVNTGTEFLALDPISRAHMECAVVWEEAWQRFVDGCIGVRYTMTGYYSFDGPPTTRSLDRYPTKIDRRGNLLIDPTQPIEGKSIPELYQLCREQPEASRQEQGVQWVEFCLYRSYQ